MINSFYVDNKVSYGPPGGGRNVQNTRDNRERNDNRTRYPKNFEEPNGSRNQKRLENANVESNPRFNDTRNRDRQPFHERRFHEGGDRFQERSNFSENNNQNGGPLYKFYNTIFEIITEEDD